MKKLLSTVLALTIMAVLVMAAPLASFAAQTVSPLLLTPVSSNSAAYHQFSIQNVNSFDVNYTWSAGSLSGTGTAAPGYNTITVNVPLSENVQCTVAWQNETGAQKIAWAKSDRSYLVTVQCVNENGAVLETKNGVSSPSSPFSYIAAATIVNGGTTYALSSTGDVWNPGYDTSLAGTTYTFHYAEVLPEAYKITVNRINSADGSVITFTMLDVQPGSTKTYTAPASFTQDGTEYKLATGQTGTVNHAYENSARVYNVYYNKIPVAPAEPYNINVRYLDSATGKAIFSKNISVPVNGTVTYDIAETYQTNSGLIYKAVAGQSKQVVHEAYNTKRLYVFYFTQDISVPTEDYSITIRLVDAVTGKILDTKTATATLNQTTRVNLDATVTYGGKSYNLANNQGREIVHPFSSSTRVYQIYYICTEQEAAEYTLAIKYATSEDNKVFATATVTVTALGVQHTPPATLILNGEEYIYAPGQPSSIVHDYSDTRREYTVFYSPASANPVIEDEEIVNPTPQPQPGENTRPEDQGNLVPEEGNNVVIVDPETPLDPEPESSEVSQPESSEETVISDPSVPLSPDQNHLNANYLWFLLVIPVGAAAALVILAAKKHGKKA